MVIEIDPIGATAMEQLLDRLYATPKDVVEKLKAIYNTRATE
jgi:hypothetical protein